MPSEGHRRAGPLFTLCHRRTQCEGIVCDRKGARARPHRRRPASRTVGLTLLLINHLRLWLHQPKLAKTLGETVFFFFFLFFQK